MQRIHAAKIVSAVVLVAVGGFARATVADPPVPPPRPPAAPATPPPPPRPSLAASEETGLASWYGHPYHGRRTTSGEIYDMRKLTAAHPTLPMGARVEVTNLDNGRSVRVRVNDRGPFEPGRVIDLSYAAARRLRAAGRGVVPVRVRVVGMPGSMGLRRVASRR